VITASLSRARRFAARGAAVVAVGLVAMLVVGCAAPSAPKIDGTRIEQKILGEAVASGARITKVSCPAGRAAQANESFQCTATVNGGAPLAYDVLISSDQGDYSYKLAPNQTLDGLSVAAEVTADVAASSPDFATATVVCPKQIVAPTGSASFECALTLGDTSATLMVTKQPGQVAAWAFKK